MKTPLDATLDAPLAQPLVEHAEAIARLCQTHGVQGLEVFGSAATGRFDDRRSDVDLIVRFAPESQSDIARRFFAFNEALELLLGRRVDLMTDQPIANPYFRAAVEASRRALYVRPAAQASA